MGGFTFSYDEKVTLFHIPYWFQKPKLSIPWKKIPEKNEGKWQNICLAKSRVLLTKTTFLFKFLKQVDDSNKLHKQAWEQFPHPRIKLVL